MNLTKNNSNLIPLSILTIIIAAVFWNAVPHDFVWDDLIFVTYKEAYRNFDLSTIFFSLANGLEYQPIRDITYAIDFQLWGRNPAGFHFSNVVYYWLNCIVVYFLSKTLYQYLTQGTAFERARSVGLFTAALFAVHPLHCEVVDFITCRNTLISGMFFFISCYAYLLYLTDRHNQQYRYYVTALICFVLALFAKTTAIMLPFILILVTEFTPRTGRKLGAAAILPFLGLSIGAFWLFKKIAQYTHIMQPEPVRLDWSSLAAKLALAIQIPVFYLGKLVAPLELAAEYDIPFADTLFAMRTMRALLILAGLLAVAWAIRRRFPLFLFCLGWYLAALLPVLHLFPTSPVVADRYAYLPSFAFFFLMATIAERIAVPARARGVIATASIIIISWSALVLKQNRVWENPKTLWENAIRVSPHATTPLTNLGRYYYLVEKRHDMALALFRHAQLINPYDPHYDIFLGIEYLLRNDPQNAAEVLQRALAKNPEHMETLINLGKAHEALGNLPSARDYYQRAVNSTEADPPGDLRERARKHLRRLGGT